MKSGSIIMLGYGINGSLRHKTTNSGTGPFEEFYLFAASGNLQAYCRGYNDYAWYGYDASNTRTCKLRMQNAAQWHDGCPDELRMHADQAVFYPNQYLTFTKDGYTKHYYAVTQGFLYAPFGEIVAEYQGIAATAALPKYAFNAKELDEESGMYCYLAALGFLLFAQQRQTRSSLCSLIRRFEARYYAPPTFTSRDPLFEQKPWLTPYHYCSNNPVGRVDPTGMFDDEAEANKFHQRAVKKYGSERVGDVYNAGNSENPDYQFRIYDKGKGKDKQWISTGENGISVCAYKGNSISKGKDDRQYKHSQGNGILTVKMSFTVGAQAGGEIKGKGVSVNLSSVDLASVEYSTGQKIKFNHVNEYGETTHRAGFSYGLIDYNYTKEPRQEANHSFGFTRRKGSSESNLGINISTDGTIGLSIGAACIIGINLDINYKW